jgi:hypothetical protein
MMRLLQALAIITVAAAVCGFVTACYGYSDREQAYNNTFGSWTSELWSQSSGDDFQKDVAWQADVLAGEGDAMLANDTGNVNATIVSMAAPMAVALPAVTPTPGLAVTATPTQNPKPAIPSIPTLAVAPTYCPAGALASTILDTGIEGALWDALFWDETLPASTGITFWARASDSEFTPEDDAVAWVAIGKTSPVTAGLPAGRYKQWRVNMTTSDASSTPVLHEVRVWYH